MSVAHTNTTARETAARASTTPRVLAWPADRFFWAVLTPEPGQGAALLRGTTASPSARAVLDELFADHLPLPLEECATAYSAVGAAAGAGGSAGAADTAGASRSPRAIIACAVPLEVTRALPPAVTALRPSEAPACVAGALGAPGVLEAGQSIDLSALNVLAGRAEPARVAALRRGRTAVIVGGLALVMALTALGLERRAGNLRARARAAEQAAAALWSTPRAAGLQATGLPELDPSADPYARTLALRAHLDRLRRTRAGVAGLAELRGFDAADALASLLPALPRDARARVAQLSATPEGVTLAATLPSHERAEALTAALLAAPGWAMTQPEISAARAGSGGVDASVSVRVTLAAAARGSTARAQEAGP